MQRVSAWYKTQDSNITQFNWCGREFNGQFVVILMINLVTPKYLRGCIIRLRYSRGRIS